MKIVSSDFGHVLEERPFTNPRIRFRRIGGRIVPIINKKKIGEDVEQTGGAIVKGSSMVAAVGGIAKMVSNYKKKRTEFRIMKGLPVMRGPSIAPKKGAARAVGRFILKNPGKISVAGLLLGTMISLEGANMQMDSAFGRDIL